MPSNPFDDAWEESDGNPFDKALEDEPSFLEKLARSFGAGAIRAAELPLLASPLVSGGLALAKGELPGFAVRHTLEDVAKNVEAQVPGGTTMERIGEQIAGGLPAAAVNTGLQALGGPLATAGAGGYQAALSAYEQARQAGESPLSAGLGAGGEALVGAVAAPLAGAAALGKFAPQGAGLIRQLLTSGAIDAATGAGQTAATLGREVLQGQQISDPVRQVLESAAANAAIGMAARGSTLALEPRSRVEPRPAPTSEGEAPRVPVTESVTQERRVQPDLREAVDHVLAQVRGLDDATLAQMMDEATANEDLVTQKAIERVAYERSGQEAKRQERISVPSEVMPDRAVKEPGIGSLSSAELQNRYDHLLDTKYRDLDLTKDLPPELDVLLTERDRAIARERRGAVSGVIKDLPDGPLNRDDAAAIVEGIYRETRDEAFSSTGQEMPNRPDDLLRRIWAQIINYSDIDPRYWGDIEQVKRGYGVPLPDNVRGGLIQMRHIAGRILSPEVMPRIGEQPQRVLTAEQTPGEATPPTAVRGQQAAGGEIPEFKFERLDLPESQRDELRQVLADTLPKGTISWAETEAQAKAHEGKDLGKKAKLTRPEHFALEQALGGVGKEIETLRSVENRTPEQDGALNELVLKRNAMFMASQRAGTETGRALNALKAFRKAGIAALKPEDRARLQLSKTYWDQLDDAGRTALADLDLKDNTKVYEWLRRVEKPSVLRMITTNFKASILSGVPTNIRNIAGNTAQLFTEMASRPIAAGVETVRSVFTKEPPRISLKDQPSAYRGLAEGFNTGAAKAWHILKSGQSVVDTTGGDKFHIRMDPFQLSSSKVVRGAGKVLTLPFRPLAAMDALFSEMGFQAKRHEIASEMARLKGGDSAKYMNDADVLSAANEFAKKVTYQDKPSRAAGAINELIFTPRKNKVSRAIAAGGEMIVPFVNIPDRVAARMMDATPLGLLYNAGQAGVDWTPEVSQRIATGVAGSTLMMLGGAGLSAGLITAGVPKDPDERAQFYALKKRAYSIKIQGKDVPFRMLGPWGAALAIGAEAVQKAKESAMTGDTEANKLMAGALGGFLGAGKYMLDASYLQTLSKVVGAFEEGGGSQALNELRGQVYNIAAGNVPFSAILRNVAQATDQRVLERPKSVMEAVQQGIPGQTQKFPARLNPYGEETKREESPAMAFIPRDAPLAAFLSENEPTAIDAELAKHGLTASYVGKSLTLKKGEGSVKLTKEQQREYQRVTGQELKKALEKLFASSFYQRLSAERQKKRIDDVMDEARTKGQLIFKRDERKRASL